MVSELMEEIFVSNSAMEEILEVSELMEEIFVSVNSGRMNSLPSSTCCWCAKGQDP